MPNYLLDYWNSVVDTIVGGVTYTASFFQQIGSAVAGAVGYVFASVIKFAFDLGMTVVYLFKGLASVVGLVFKPLIFIFNVITGAFPNASSLSSATTTVPTIASSTTSFFASIFPSGFSLSAFWGVIYAIFIVSMLIASVKMFQKT
jgi:hypothetical protein